MLSVSLSVYYGHIYGRQPNNVGVNPNTNLHIDNYEAGTVRLHKNLLLHPVPLLCPALMRLV